MKGHPLNKRYIFIFVKILCEVICNKEIEHVFVRNTVVCDLTPCTHIFMNGNLMPSSFDIYYERWLSGPHAKKLNSRSPCVLDLYIGRSPCALNLYFGRSSCAVDLCVGRSPRALDL